MSVFLTPSLHPIYGGTYFRPQQFVSLIMQISKLWEDDAAELQTKGEKVMKLLNEAMNKKGGEEGAATNEQSEESERKQMSTYLESCYQAFASKFDATLGGFGNAPKFPRPVEMNALFRYYYRNRNSDGVLCVLCVCL